MQHCKTSEHEPWQSMVDTEINGNCYYRPQWQLMSKETFNLIKYEGHDSDINLFQCTTLTLYHVITLKQTVYKSSKR